MKFRNILWIGMLGLGIVTNAFADLNNGLVAHYSFDGNISDVSGNNTEIIIPSSHYFLEGAYNQGIGILEDQSNAGQITVLNPFSEAYFTISFWGNAVVDHNQAYGDSSVHVWHDNTDKNQQSFGFTLSSGNNAFYLQHEYPELIVTDSVSNADVGKSLYYGANQLVEKTWQHIVLTYDNGNISVYVNALPIIENKYTSISPVGRNLDITLRGNDALDALRIYNRVLSSSEIQLLSSGETNCPAVEIGTVSPNLDIHMPSLIYRSLSGEQYIWGDFVFYGEGANGELLWKLSAFGINP